ncbi:WD40 repeat-like protein [Colletotrichum caudatum]|nr:WD40 repeat-like protein [Colletotrichum caudatum]
MELSEFIKDASKVIASCGSMIKQTPLQIYRALILFSPVASKVVASALEDKMVWLWDVSTGAHRQTLEGHVGPVSAVAFLPDGQVDVATGVSSVAFSPDSQVDAATGVHRQTLRGHDGPVCAVAFSLDGQVVATWIMKGNETVLWLPNNYRPTSSAVRGSVMFIGCSSGRVILRTSG